MILPFNIPDLGIWLAGMALILLATSEVIVPHYERASIDARTRINRRRLRLISTLVSIAFIVVSLINVLGTM